MWRYCGGVGQGGLDWLHHLPQDFNSTSVQLEANIKEQVRLYAQRAINNRKPLLFLDICVPAPVRTTWLPPPPPLLLPSGFGLTRASSLSWCHASWSWRQGYLNGCSSSLSWSTIKPWLDGIPMVVDRFGRYDQAGRQADRKASTRDTRAHRYAPADSAWCQ